MDKPVHLGLSILETSKVVMYEVWYDYVNQNMEEKAKLCYMDTDSFRIYIKTEDIYVDIAKDVETKFHTSTYKLEQPLPKGKNKKVIESMKDKLGRKIMSEFSALIQPTYSYLTDVSENKRSTKKGTKKRFIKRKLKFEDYKHCLEAIQLEKNKPSRKI